MSDQLCATVVSLMDAVPALELTAPSDEERAAIIDRGFFRPAENEAIAHWFARFLSQREVLWAVVNEIDESFSVPLSKLKSPNDWRRFVIGYSAACLLVRQDRFLLSQLATDSLIQRKLNEAFPEYRIPRKQYSAIFSGYTDPLTALQLYDAMSVARRRRRQISALENDDQVGVIVRQLSTLESYLDPSKRSYFKRLLQFISHRWRRRGASAAQQTIFAVLEGFGRTASRINPGSTKRVTDIVRSQVAQMAKPGDVFVSRHAYALTNYLLPGVWPHTSLYIGTPEQRHALGLDLDPAIAARWIDDKCTLEALRDGVKFRPLAETLSVDYFVILRPQLEREQLAEAIGRVIQHEGKGYNFDFDFFTSDKLVCTEVIYRAFDGIGQMDIPLFERAGRQTLSAEDLLDLALDTEQFDPVAIFGYPEGEKELITGDRVVNVLTNSYRTTTT